MRVLVVETAGVGSSLFGMGLSHGITSFDVASIDNDAELDLKQELLSNRAEKLAPLDGGHNKFLESIVAWVLIEAPRYWWQEKDTYRHLSKQSESTMHTLHKEKLTRDNFESGEINPAQLLYLNDLITIYRQYKDSGDKSAMERALLKIKRNLPEGFLQTRMVRLDMKSLRNIYFQRRFHRLPEWKIFLEEISVQLPRRVWRWVTAERSNNE